MSSIRPCHRPEENIISKHNDIIRADGAVSRDGTENARSYDAWANGYDTDLAAWDYVAPREAAARLKARLAGFAEATLLDCGCGTGLTGEALRDAGSKGTLIGLDLSEKSLAQAAHKGIYHRLEPADLNTRLPLDDDAVDGALCVGVLTYVEEPALLREFTRVIRPGGVVVFTSRDDFYQSRGIAALIQSLADEGVWSVLDVSEPMDYLPGNPEFGDKVKVRYIACRIT